MTVITAAPVHPAPVPAAPAARARTAVLAALAVAVFAVGFLVVGHQRLVMPFGDSHDGRNGTQWGLGSRDLRQQGPVTSHLGADLVAGARRQPYTDHPPLIYSETAAAESIFGEHPWVTRLPAWLASLAVIVLCFELLRRSRLSPVAAAIGTALGLGCPMFGAYGLMNDPWILGLPWGIAMLVLWRDGRSGRPWPWWAVAAVALVGALTSWVNVIELALLVCVELVPVVRSRRRGHVGPTLGR